jgi:hypothetical protein
MMPRIQKFDINIFSRERPRSYGFIGCDTGRRCFDDILPRMPINNWVVIAEQPKLYNITPIISSSTSNTYDDILDNCRLRTGALENIGKFELFGLIIEQNTPYKYNISMKYVFMNSRSYRIPILFVINPQFLYLPPVLRDLDYVFIAKETCINDRRSVYDYYAGGTSFEIFCSIVDLLCDSDFNFMVIDNTCNTYDIDKNYFFY